MATSVESPSPVSLNKRSPSLRCSSPPMFSPCSDKRFWSTLRSRTETLIENRKPIDHPPQAVMNGEPIDRSRRLKEDSMLLLRGFDSVAQSLSQLSNNLENALQGAKDLARPPPVLADIVHADDTLEKAKIEKSSLNEEKKDEQEEDDEVDKRGLKRKLDSKECTEDDQVEQDSLKPPVLADIVHADDTLEKAKIEKSSLNEEKKDEQEEDDEVDKRGLKRKLDSKECTEDDQVEQDSLKPQDKGLEKIKKAKNLAISMATKAATMAIELKSIRSDLGFMQDKCALLEEENRKLREGLANGIPPEEDDLVRLQLETLLAEKSRLANENANLTRENQSLLQLVEYHQLTTHDLSASYENLIRGMGLDFSSPPENADDDDRQPMRTSHADILGFSKSLDECFDEEEE